MEWLAQVFSLVCGQNPAHTWAPGGVVLPCCQRCTGLYAGAAAALLLQLLLRPRLTSRFLQLHGLLLLQMVPFGFHWLPQGPVVRTLTGLLFGYGVVAFLSCLPRTRWPAGRDSETHQTMPASPPNPNLSPNPNPSPFPSLVAPRVGVLSDPRTSSRRRNDALYWCMVGASLLVVPAWACRGGPLPAKALGAACFAGLLGLTALVVVNMGLAVAWAASRLGRRAEK